MCLFKETADIEKRFEISNYLIKLPPIVNYGELIIPIKNRPKDSRCKYFAMFYVNNQKGEGKNGIIIEYSNSGFVISSFADRNYYLSISLDDIKSYLPVRIKQLLAHIQKFYKDESSELTAKDLRKMLETAFNKVWTKSVRRIDRYEPVFSDILYLCNHLMEDNSGVHTYLYEDKPFKGQNKALFVNLQPLHVDIPVKIYRPIFD